MSDGLPSLDAYPSSQRGRIETMLKELPLRDPVTGLVSAKTET
jgi:penicillin-binding protein 2